MQAIFAIRVRFLYGCVCAVALMSLGCESATDAASEQSAKVDALAQQVIHAEDVAESSSAIESLQAMGADSAPALARAMRESTSPAVRERVAQTIASTEAYAALPELLEALDDESPEVRRAADAATQSLLIVSVRYDADASPEERRAAIERYRHYWNRRNTPEMRAIGKDPEKAKKAMEEQTIFQ